MGDILALYTLLHVAISLVAIASGFVVFYQMLRETESGRWTTLFLSTTILTSVTGFGFPISQFTPGLAFGIISLVVLGLALYGRYTQHLAGRWRTIYIVGVVLAQYLNVMVLIVQSFQKIPALTALAPTQTEPVFLLAQTLNLVAMLLLALRLILKPTLSHS